MSSPHWSTTPPTKEQWLEVESHGMWWVKFLMMPEEKEVDPEDGKEYTWPEIWYVDCVQILSAGLPGDEDEHLVARGFILKEFRLDDKEATKELFWQPVKTPDDDIKR